MNCSACGHTFLDKELAHRYKVKCPDCGHAIKKKNPNPWTLIFTWSGWGSCVCFVLSILAVIFAQNTMMLIFSGSTDGLAGMVLLYIPPASLILGAIVGGIVGIFIVILNKPR